MTSCISLPTTKYSHPGGEPRDSGWRKELFPGPVCRPPGIQGGSPAYGKRPDEVSAPAQAEKGWLPEVSKVMTIHPAAKAAPERPLHRLWRPSLNIPLLMQMWMLGSAPPLAPGDAGTGSSQEKGRIVPGVAPAGYASPPAGSSNRPGVPLVRPSSLSCGFAGGSVRWTPSVLQSRARLTASWCTRLDPAQEIPGNSSA